MIRYVLAIVLTTALLGIGVAGVDHAATIRSEQQVETQVAKIESAATSLLETEEPTPPGRNGARRVIELDLPGDGFASKPVEMLRIRPDPSGVSIIEYRIDERVNRTRHVGTIIENQNAGSSNVTDLSGQKGSVTLALSLESTTGGTYRDREVYVALRVQSRGR